MATPYLPPVIFDGVIDISHYQPTADFAAVESAGIAAVFIKATEGADSVDPLWVTHTEAADTAGLLTGSYHFVTGDDAPTTQAEHFLNTVKPSTNAVLMLDWETNPSGTTASGDQVAAIGKACQAATGRAPLIYCGRWQLAVAHPVLSQWPLMLPEYGGTPICPPGWSAWLFHQYTGAGYVAGITGAVDRSVFAGTADALNTWWISGETA